MINLNTVYKAEAQPTREFTIIPKGTYRAEIVEVEDWKINKTKNPITVKKTNEVLPAGIEIASMRYKVKICDNDNKGYNGRVVRGEISTHPNMPWQIPSFLDAIGVSECSLNDVKNYALNAIVNAYIITEEKTKVETNPETGLDEPVTKVYNKVASIKKPKSVAVEEDF